MPRVALILMIVLAYFLAQSPKQLVAWGATATTDPTTTMHYDVRQVARARILGWILWWIMLALHAIPIRLFIESAGRTQRRWEELLALRPDMQRYEQLSPHPFAIAPPPEPSGTTTSPAPVPSSIHPPTWQAPRLPMSGPGEGSLEAESVLGRPMQTIPAEQPPLATPMPPMKSTALPATTITSAPSAEHRKPGE